ncbi:MAG TPA: beta-L-arabinofuranosidase domain-containing protein [Verrucomicrobiae bacterium]|nr:beta-L-arabinofuranosidase domain-containing protein [Verrucomicrobiae bacterium]
MRYSSSLLIFAALIYVFPARAEQTIARSLETAPARQRNPFYAGPRKPLAPAPFLKLPIGAIRPEGWLRQQLLLESDGMTGKLPELSKWCQFEGSAWTDPNGEGTNGWEELPYWLKGYGDLGYVLGDKKIIATAGKWINAVLASQQPDGWFGPRALKTGLKGYPDLWPQMVMCNVLQSFYEFSGDARVVPFLSHYFHWMSRQPPETFGRGYWPKIRFGDDLATVYWLYDRTGDESLLKLARDIHENMQDWTSGVHDWHNVNIAQGFREPAIFYQQARQPRFLAAAERDYDEVMDVYGQFPGGGFAGDENCRPGFTDPRQGFETCGIVEFMHSFEMLTKISGRPAWSDRCEDIAFNSFPAAVTPDWKGLHYLTCANQVQLDKGSKAPGIENGGTMFSYSPLQVYRCCQHNVSHGWPYYSEELWLATSDRGLCASLYSASEVSATAGDGAKVRISEETDYPFSEDVVFKLAPERPARFPLYLRIPGWCSHAAIRVNGHRASIHPRGLSYVSLERMWKAGDVVRLTLPMEVSVKRWDKNKNGASVSYGPLSFSLDIGERWSRYGGTDQWPEFEVFPTSDWNYALDLKEKRPERGLKVRRAKGKLANQPFTPETAPLWIEARARKVSQWRQDEHGLLEPLPQSPVQTDEPEEKVKLIPMGAARLRISVFPVAAER